MYHSLLVALSLYIYTFISNIFHPSPPSSNYIYPQPLNSTSATKLLTLVLSLLCLTKKLICSYNAIFPQINLHLIGINCSGLPLYTYISAQGMQFLLRRTDWTTTLFTGFTCISGLFSYPTSFHYPRTLWHSDATHWSNLRSIFLDFLGMIVASEGGVPRSEQTS